MQHNWLKNKKIPDLPGVYTFRDYKKRPLYIGRATSLKDRTKSYFSNDLIKTRGPRIVDMVTKSKSLTWQETNSVLEAILLESLLIKRYQPQYNVDERDDKSSYYVVITAEDWPRIFLERGRDLEKREVGENGEYKILKTFGPFAGSGLIKESLKILRRIFPFRDKKSKDPRHELFYREIGRSPEIADNDSQNEYKKTVNFLVKLFEGKGDKLREEIKREMNHCAQNKEFEEAGRLKRSLYALNHINDMALIKRKESLHSDPLQKEFRIEAFDIAHISGSNVVGAMVVSINGVLDKSQYRKFKLSKDKNDDLAGLREIISRRLNHSEWPYPDLIVVDGNEMQKKLVENILSVRRINIPVIAVTKDEKHKTRELVGNQDLIKKYQNQIIAINAEAHRFAIGYHRKLREKGFV